MPIRGPRWCLVHRWAQARRLASRRPAGRGGDLFQPNPQATSEAALAQKPPVGERYDDQLGWTVYEDGQEAYLPDVVRDWYAVAWFDWHLKGEDAARACLVADDPFGERTHVRKELR